MEHPSIQNRWIQEKIKKTTVGAKKSWTFEGKVRERDERTWINWKKNQRKWGSEEKLRITKAFSCKKDHNQWYNQHKGTKSCENHVKEDIKSHWLGNRQPFTWNSSTASLSH